MILMPCIDVNTEEVHGIVHVWTLYLLSILVSLSKSIIREWIMP